MLFQKKLRSNNVEDTYVYISVKLYLKPGQTESSIDSIIQETGATTMADF